MGCSDPGWVLARMAVEKVIREWRVLSEGPGYFVWFDPRSETVRLYDEPSAPPPIRGFEGSQLSPLTGDQLMMQLGGGVSVSALDAVKSSRSPEETAGPLRPGEDLPF